MNKIYSLILLIGALFMFSSCEEEEVVEVHYFPVVVSNTVENAIYYQLGLDFLSYNASQIVNESIVEPKESYQYNTDVNNSWANGWSNYEYHYNATTVGDEINFDSSVDGEYETYLMTSDDESESQTVLSQISASSDYFLLSGNASKDGFQYSKTYKDSFNSTVDLNFENLEVNRITGYIKHGTVSFIYNGTSSYGVSYNCTGKIEYNDYVSILVFD